MFIIGVILPFFIFVITGLFGRFLGFLGTKKIISIGMIVTVLMNINNWYASCLNEVIFLKITNAIAFNNFIWTWSFQFDSLVCTMVLMVTVISFCVQMYSFIYMKDDPHIIRFLMYLQLFTFFMLLFVSAGNIIQLFIGWEGIGVCSYFLINFWFNRIQANKAAIKAMLMNKIGDSGLLICFSLIFLCIKTIDFAVIFSAEFIFSLNNLVDLLIENSTSGDGLKWYTALAYPLVENTGFLHWSPSYIFNTWNQNYTNYIFVDLAVDILGILIFSFCFLGIMSKSAQLGLHMWLPDAMEGPTPVSALIHAATMVTAGIYLFIRISPVFDQYPYLLGVIVSIGAITAFYSAITAAVQHDAKKIIAFSTCSQLGYMVIAAGLSSYATSFFHLVNHAVFKALLFMTAGSLIHIMMDDQDIRNLGFISTIAPLTKNVFIIATMTSIGVPFLTGFYSKDMIIEISYILHNRTAIFSNELASNFTFTISIAAALFTTFYSMRLILISFFYQTRSPTVILTNLVESPYSLTLILLILSLGSIFTGFLCKEYFVGINTINLHSSFPTRQGTEVVSNSEYLPIFIKCIPTLGMVIVVAMTILAFTSYSYLLWSAKTLYLKWADLLTNNLNFNWIEYHIIKGSINVFYSKVFLNLDKGIFEKFGPINIIKTIKQLVTFIMSFQTRSIYDYSINAVLSGTTLLSLCYIGYSFFLTNLTSNVFQQSNLITNIDIIINCSICISIVSAIFCFWVEHNKPIVSLGFFLLTIIPNIVILLILKVEYLALIMLIVYAGAIVILFLFILIMSNPTRVLIKSTPIPLKEQPWIISITVILLVIIYICFSSKFTIYLNWYEQFNQTEISYSYTNQFIFYTQTAYDITIFGEYLLNNAAIIIFLSGIVLLIAMIGSIIITLL